MLTTILLIVELLVIISLICTVVYFKKSNGNKMSILLQASAYVDRLPHGLTLSELADRLVPKTNPEYVEKLKQDMKTGKE